MLKSPSAYLISLQLSNNSSNMGAYFILSLFWLLFGFKSSKSVIFDIQEAVHIF